MQFGSVDGSWQLAWIANGQTEFVQTVVNTKKYTEIESYDSLTYQVINASSSENY